MELTYGAGFSSEWRMIPPFEAEILMRIPGHSTHYVSAKAADRARKNSLNFGQFSNFNFRQYSAFMVEQRKKR